MRQGTIENSAVDTATRQLQSFTLIVCCSVVWCVFVQSVVTKHQASLEKLFLDSILLKCDNYVLRGVASSCLVKLMEHSSHNVSSWYLDLLKWLEGKEQNARIIGLQW